MFFGDHQVVPRTIERTRAPVFWQVFKVWGGIMALSGLFFVSQARLHYQSILVEVIAPGVALGAIGAAFMSLLVRPGQKFRALPSCFLLGGLAIVLPKNEATMGYVLFGMIFAMAGAFAGIMAANSLKSQ